MRMAVRADPRRVGYTAGRSVPFLIRLGWTLMRWLQWPQSAVPSSPISVSLVRLQSRHFQRRKAWVTGCRFLAEYRRRKGLSGGGPSEESEAYDSIMGPRAECGRVCGFSVRSPLPDPF